MGVSRSGCVVYALLAVAFTSSELGPLCDLLGLCAATHHIAPGTNTVYLVA